MKKITCIGSRKTPKEVLVKMQEIGKTLSSLGFIGRSGHADGADLAFEQGFNGNFEIYLPWKKFNDNHPYLGKITILDQSINDEKAKQIASEIHPTWNKCSFGVKKLHARNVFQVLGESLSEPSVALICWTPDGKVIGGSATAINLAIKHNVPVYNLFEASEKEIIDKIESIKV